MSSGLLSFHIVAFGLAVWLGLFLLARDVRRAPLRSAGFGLLLYAAALAGMVLVATSAPEQAARLIRWTRPLLFLPSILWAGTVAHLLPEDAPLREPFVRSWNRLLLPLMAAFYLLSVATDAVFGPDGSVRPGGYLVAGAVALLPLFEVLIMLGVGLRRTGPQRHLGLLLAGLLFFSLSATLLVTPLSGPWRAPITLGMGLDLLLLGVVVAALDAFNEGEAWLPELLRSLLGGLFSALLFAGPVALTMALITGPTLTMSGLLLGLTTLALAHQTFSVPIQGLLDTLAYLGYPRLRAQQAALRQEAQAQVRGATNLDPATLEEAEFARLTRRALSHFGNLPKLAASPLTRLVLVETRLQEEGREDSTLERAAVLKLILAESIQRLAPVDEPGEMFVSTDEWRHFNALYYPYVVGLRPFSRRAAHDDLSPAEKQALTWFRTSVPERTLYNWQRAAALLVARDLRERGRLGKTED